MKILKSIFNLLATPKGLFIHLAILLCATAFLVYKPIDEFKTYDTHPLLSSSEQVLGAQFKHKKTPKIEVGFSLDSFSQFDIHNNEFIALGIVWFIYNPNEISENKIKDFSFSKGELQQKSKAITTNYDDTRKTSRYSIRLKFISPLDYHNFPIDDHRIFISLKNDSLTSEEAQFITSKENMFIEPDHLYKTTWNLVNYDAQAGYNKVTLKNDTEVEDIYLPNAVFSYDYERGGIHMIMLVLIPLIFLFFVALSIFLLLPGEGANTYRYMLFSLISYLFVLESLAPEVGYLKLSDYAYFIVFFSSFFIMTLSWMSEKMSRVQRGYIGTFVEIIMLTLLYIIFNIFR